MKTEEDLRFEALRTVILLEHWEEETGVLIQTDSDFAQRERIRERLNTKLATLKWVLQEETPAPLRAGRVPA